ncbi:MAG: DUF2150 family protein [Chloroflexi bacterium]|nr:DUF2150 family protein [Chloroflexota bacterium]
MTDQPSPMWRDTLNMVVDAISADSFRDELVWLRERYGDNPGLIGWIYNEKLTDWFVTSTGLFAALRLPPAEVPAALAEICETLTNLDLAGEQKRLDQDDDRRCYEDFSQWATMTFPELGQAMEALFNCYVAGDYDPTANPDDIIAEALEIGEEDLERAHYLIAQAGAIALHARPLWWRWEQEAYGLAEPRLTATLDLVEDYTSDGKMLLGPLEQARADGEKSLREVKEKIAELEEGIVQDEEPADLEPSPVDDLINDLIERGEQRFTPEQLALCRDHREDAISALIDLAADEYLQLEDSPGEGYAPIRAVELLGELEAVEAIPELIDIVAGTDPEAIIYSTAIHALQKMGQPVREQILTFMRYSWDVEAKIGLAEAIEVSSPDEQIYQALVEVWEEAAWEDGKCLLAYGLAQAGGEQAIPLLEAALEDPELETVLNYNEVAYALSELGVEPPPPPADLETFDFAAAIEGSVQATISAIGDPEHIMDIIGAAPEEWHSRPEALAHVYTDLEMSRISSVCAVQAIVFPLAMSLSFTDRFLQEVEMLALDASTTDYPPWLGETYDHLAECAGPELQYRLIGMLLSLKYYLGDDYDIADEPDQLLAAAADLFDSEQELEESWRLFGQAGALILHGRSFWPRWPAETDPPLSGFMEGLIKFHSILESVGQIPLRPSSEAPPDELAAAMMKAVEKEEKQPPPDVTRLLDTILTQEQGILSPAQRRRFVHQRAAVIPYLIRMVEDEQYWYEEGPGGGWATILAARLLGELKASQAVDALVSAVADSDASDVIQEAALFSLMAIGRSALSAVQAYFCYGRDVETKTALAEVLGCIGRQNTDAFDLLRQVWEDADWAQNRRMVALAFGDLCDRRAIPLLQTALEDRRTDALDQEYISWALQRLGVQEPPKKKSSRLRTPAPHSPRLIYGEFDIPQRSKYTPWGEPLCPDCGKPFVLGKDGEWAHPPEGTTHRPAPQSTKRRRKKRKQ